MKFQFSNVSHPGKSYPEIPRLGACVEAESERDEAQLREFVTYPRRATNAQTMQVCLCGDPPGGTPFFITFDWAEAKPSAADAALAKYRVGIAALIEGATTMLATEANPATRIHLAAVARLLTDYDAAFERSLPR